MKRVALIVEPSTLRISRSQKATANIWLEMDGAQFPMVQWNDFAVVILSWWTLALLRLLRGNSTQEAVHFMDGPYFVEVKISPAEILQFRALKRDLDGIIELGTGEEPAKQFIPGLISRSRDVLDACKRLNWWSKDASILESSLTNLNAALAGLPS